MEPYLYLFLGFIAIISALIFIKFFIAVKDVKEIVILRIFGLEERVEQLEEQCEIYEQGIVDLIVEKEDK